MTYNQDEFIERCQELAIEKKTNLRAITREIGISNSSFTDWKKGRGKPSIETFCKVAEYFGVSLEYLAYGKKDEQVDISNIAMPAFASKYMKLPPELQGKVQSYMDGMLATIEVSTEIPEEKRLSV